MYNICPKCKYQRLPSDTSDPSVCPACGLIFAKWMKQQFAVTPAGKTGNTSGTETGLTRLLVKRLLYVEPKTEPVFFYGRLGIYLIFFVWGWYFIHLDFAVDPFPIGNSFMHNINLVFHEAGHVFFRPLGWFMTILGGTLGQLLMPLIVMLSFIIKNQDNFAASLGLWWLGQSCMDVAPYIDDALEQKLVLLGGHTGADAPGNHDWNNILGDLNRLEKCHDYAAYTDMTGTLLMIIAFIWGGYILYLQFRTIRR